MIATNIFLCYEFLVEILLNTPRKVLSAGWRILRTQAAIGISKIDSMILDAEKIINLSA